MTFARKIDGLWVETAGRGDTEMPYSAEWFALAKPEDRERLGVFEITQSSAPQNRILISREIIDCDGRPQYQDCYTAPPVAQVAREVWDRAKQYRDRRIEGPAQTPFGLVQTDDRSLVRINGAVTMAMAAMQMQQPFEVAFTLYDNTVVVLTSQKMIQMGLAAGSYVAACQNAGTKVRRKIDDTVAAMSKPDNTLTVDDLYAIDVTEGYPVEVQ